MEYPTLDLCLFGEEGGSAPDAGDAAAEQPAAEADQSVLSKEEAFNRLISGEYRDEYVKRTQQMIDTRFKQSKELESRYNALRSVLDGLGMHTDEASGGDEPTPSPDYRMETAGEAAPAACPPEEEGNAIHAPLVPGGVMPDGAQGIFDNWGGDAYRLRSIYPDFDLVAELDGENGPQLMTMLRQGIPLRTAYQALHMDELLQNALSYAVENTRQRTMESIRARGLRPEEAAAGAPAAAAQILRADPAQWDPDEMNSAIQQARMGKKIYL